MKWPLICGVIAGLAGMLLTVGLGMAAPLPRGVQPTATPNAQTCRDCHLDIADSWSNSSHAHAYDDTNFQNQWRGLGEPNCLLCHTTNFQATSGQYDAQGVSCEACHGKVNRTTPQRRFQFGQTQNIVGPPRVERSPRVRWPHPGYPWPFLRHRSIHREETPEG